MSFPWLPVRPASHVRYVDWPRQLDCPAAFTALRRLSECSTRGSQPGLLAGGDGVSTLELSRRHGFKDIRKRMELETRALAEALARKPSGDLGGRDSASEPKVKLGVRDDFRTWMIASVA